MSISPPTEVAAVCLGIPMRIERIEGHSARCHAKGIEREVNLFLLADQVLNTGDYVMVHVGYAIQKIAPEEAATAWELYDRMTGSDHA